MTREEFKVIVKGMKAVYTQEGFIPDSDAFDVWFGLLQDIPYRVATVAAQKYMATERFAPTIADIRKNAEEIMMNAEGEMSEAEAWARLKKAIGNSLYNSEEEFEKLPEAIQKAVASPGVLREMGMMDSSQLNSVEKSHFLRAYREETNRTREDLKLPSSVRSLISELKQTAIGIESKGG